MKCIIAEKFILLQDSGELGANKALELEAHLAGCESCRQFNQVLRATETSFGAGHEPSIKVVQDVLRAAHTNAPERKHLPVFGWKPALAMAASVVILLGLVLGNYNANRVGMELMVTDAQFMNAEDQVVSVMYDGLSEDDLAFNFLMTNEG